MQDVTEWIKEYLQMTEKIIGDDIYDFWDESLENREHVAIVAVAANFIEDPERANKFRNIIIDNVHEEHLGYWLNKGKKLLRQYLIDRSYLYGVPKLDKEAEVLDYANTLLEIGVHNIRKNHRTGGLEDLSQARAIYLSLEMIEKAEECKYLIIANGYPQVMFAYWENEGRRVFDELQKKGLVTDLDYILRDLDSAA